VVLLLSLVGVFLLFIMISVPLIIVFLLTVLVLHIVLLLLCLKHLLLHLLVIERLHIELLLLDVVVLSLLWIDVHRLEVCAWNGSKCELLLVERHLVRIFSLVLLRYVTAKFGSENLVLRLSLKIHLTPMLSKLCIN
jgi:hypothetical protein